MKSKGVVKMNKQILMVSSSYRKEGNSETLSKEFKQGAEDAGNKIEIIYLRNLYMEFCKGCMACQKTGKCVIQDDIVNSINLVKNADVLVFATPIYYYSMSGQLKTFLDRMNPLYVQEFKKKEVYLIASAADENSEAIDGALKEVEGWSKCFDDIKLVGVIRGVNCNQIGEVKNKKELLQEAYEMGRNV